MLQQDTEVSGKDLLAGWQSKNLINQSINEGVPMSRLFKVALSSELLESANAAHFHQEIEKIIEDGGKILLLDLKNVHSLTNSSLMSLVSILQMVRAANCILLISSINEQVRILFELTGLEKIFNSFPAGE